MHLLHGATMDCGALRHGKSRLIRGARLPACADYALAPFQPEWVMSKMMPSGSWYFFS